MSSRAQAILHDLVCAVLAVEILWPRRRISFPDVGEEYVYGMILLVAAWAVTSFRLRLEAKWDHAGLRREPIVILRRDVIAGLETVVVLGIQGELFGTSEYWRAVWGLPAQLGLVLVLIGIYRQEMRPNWGR